MASSDMPPRPTTALDRLIATLSGGAAERGCFLLSASGEVLFGAAPESGLTFESADFVAYESREVAAGSGAVKVTALPMGDVLVFLCRPQTASEDDLALARIRALLAHDLRVPLQALVAEADLSGTMTATAHDAMTRIDGILMLSDAGGTAALLRDFDPARAVADIVRLLGPIAARRGINIALTVPDHPGVVHGAEALFRMLAQNMIGNAVQHGTAPERVVLSMSLCAPGEWQIRLEHWQRAGSLPHAVLETLVRGTLDDAVPAVSNGTALMHAAGHLLRAKWAIATEGEAEALCVTLTLPEAATLGEAGPQPEDDGRLTGAHILIVEDNPVIREWSARVLRQAGAVVGTAADGQAGLMLAENARPRFDAVLLDLVLPGLDGLTVARRLCLRQPQLRPKIIGFSAHDDIDGEKAGLDMVLRKPVSAHVLRSSLASLLAPTNKSGPPMPNQRDTAETQPLFNAAIVRELAGDLGETGARAFMERACTEASATLGALKVRGFGAETRAALHSSVGSCGITGLNRIEMGLRRIQDTGKAGGELSALYLALETAIGDTRAALQANGAPFSGVNQM